MTQAVALAQYGSTGVSQGFKNRIINGAMVIDQRNAGASVTPADNTYSLDRWRCALAQSSKYSVQQNAGSVTPPAGFTNYLGVTSLSAYSSGSSDYFGIDQSIEGFNTADLNFGSANAKTITISFWVRSSLTGTFGGSIRNSALNRSYVFSYSISAANTWEQKSVTIAGDTSGTWIGATNGNGIRLWFDLGSGSSFNTAANAWTAGSFLTSSGNTSVVGTNGATFYITGVQFEVGSTATSFDYRPYGTELMLCLRYYQRYSTGSQSYPLGPFGYCYGDTQAAMTHTLPVPMRATPSISFSTLVTRGGVANGSNPAPSITSFSDVQSIRPYMITYSVTVNSNVFLAGTLATVANNASNDTSHFAYTAEL